MCQSILRPCRRAATGAAAVKVRGRARDVRAVKAHAKVGSAKGVSAGATMLLQGPRNERIDTIHTKADCDLAAGIGGDARRLARLLLAAGGIAAASRLSDDPGDDAAPRCEPGHDGRARDCAART